MNNESTLLLKLICENKSLNEISSTLGLSPKQIHMRLTMLRNSGYLFDRSFKYNGDTLYSFHDPLTQQSNTFIAIPNDINTIRAILISDTHFGHNNDNINYIDAIYNYCTKVGINIIIHAGDFFEGICESRIDQLKFKTAEEQISYVLQKYPYDKNILNFILLGNHDYSLWNEAKIDIKNILSNRRHDLIPIGYKQETLYIKDYKFDIIHKGHSNNIKISNECYISLYGHSHKFSIECNPYDLKIHIPTLSRVQTPQVKNPQPSMIDMTLNINKDLIEHENFKQFILKSKYKTFQPILLSEMNCYSKIKSYHKN